MKGIDFTALNKQTLDMVLKNGTRINVLPPTVKQCSDLQKVGNDIESLSACLSDILSHNEKKIPVRAKELQEYDLEELVLIFTSLSDFIQEVANQKH